MFKGKEVYPRSVTEKNEAICSYHIRFYLVLTSDGVSFNKAIEKLISKDTLVNYCISPNIVNSTSKYDYKP